jgi:hypothetical protein
MSDRELLCFIMGTISALTDTNTMSVEIKSSLIMLDESIKLQLEEEK